MPITKSTPLATIIDDFVHSENPKFAGKSKEDRIRMAKGAFYGMQKEDINAANESSNDFDDEDAFAHGYRHGAYNMPKNNPHKKGTRDYKWYEDGHEQGKADFESDNKTTMQNKHESLELLNAISEGNTIASAEIFSAALMSKISTLVEEHRQEVASRVFNETTQAGYHALVNGKSVSGPHLTRVHAMAAAKRYNNDIEGNNEKSNKAVVKFIRHQEVAESISESIKTEKIKVPVGDRPKGIGWSLHRSGAQHNEPHDIYKRSVKESIELDEADAATGKWHAEARPLNGNPNAKRWSYAIVNPEGGTDWGHTGGYNFESKQVAQIEGDKFLKQYIQKKGIKNGMLEAVGSLYEIKQRLI